MKSNPQISLSSFSFDCFIMMSAAGVGGNEEADSFQQCLTLVTSAFKQQLAPEERVLTKLNTTLTRLRPQFAALLDEAAPDSAARKQVQAGKKKGGRGKGEGREREGVLYDTITFAGEFSLEAYTHARNGE